MYRRNTHLDKVHASHPSFNGIGENMWVAPENEFTASVTIGSWCQEGKIMISKMTLASATVLIIFSLFGTIPTKLLVLLLHAQELEILDMQHFSCALFTRAKQQATGYAEEDGKAVWPKPLKPPTVKHMVKRLLSFGVGFFSLAISIDS